MPRLVTEWEWVATGSGAAGTGWDCGDRVSNGGERVVIGCGVVPRLGRSVELGRDGVELSRDQVRRAETRRDWVVTRCGGAGLGRN